MVLLVVAAVALASLRLAATNIQEATIIESVKMFSKSRRIDTLVVMVSLCMNKINSHEN